MNIIESVLLFLQQNCPNYTWEIHSENPNQIMNLPYGNNEPSIGIEYKPELNRLVITSVEYVPIGKSKSTFVFVAVDLSDAEIQEKILGAIG